MNTETTEMTAETVGRQLLNLFVSHMRMLPDVWPKMNQTQQDETLDAVREGVKSAIEKAVHLIAADNRLVVAGTLDSISIKNGVRCNVNVNKASENILGLYSAQGQDVLLVVANPTYFTQGIHQVVGEADQRAIELGHEYNEDDTGFGDSESESTDSDTITSGSIREPDTEEVDPELDNAIVAVQTHGRTSISFLQKHLAVGYNRAARLMEQLEIKGVVTAPGMDGVRSLIGTQGGLAA
jgi:hypothetical protein